MMTEKLKYMKCRACGAELKEDWNYCPYCGASKYSTGLEEIFEMFEKSFKSMFGENISDFPFGRGFLVEISRKEDEEPRISIKELGKLGYLKREETSKKNQESKNMKVVEPEVKVLEKGKLVKIFLPDVESEKNINIKKLQNSIEIKAFGKGKTYFTIIPNPNLTYKKFENGMLLLKFI